jgi:protein-S-isoprenylcysteine O-methyltransferase Ste14
LAVSLVLVVEGVRLLRKIGDSTKPPEDSSDFQFEHTSTLVTTGVYRYIRHPMYASLFFLTWGAVAKQMGFASVVAGLLATVCLIATARAEERENVERFGKAYREYMARTKRFVPFLF